MKFKIGKKYLNRQYETVRIICIDAEGEFPVVGLCKCREDGKEVAQQFDSKGRYYPEIGEYPLDLIAEIIA